LVDLDPTQGHEIQKTRPCVVVSADRFCGKFSTLVVVPITSLKPGATIYKSETRISAGEGGLSADSKAMAIQVRTIDKIERVVAIKGKLTQATMREIDSTLRLVLGLIPGV
jgi:mRNA interferase MazF